MKKILLLVIICSNIGLAAQMNANRFEENDENSVVESNEDANTTISNKGPGNPNGDDDLPIDDYIPLLVAAAIGLIVFKKYKNHSVS